MARYIDSKYLVDWCNEMYQKQTQIKGKEYCNAFLQTVVTAPTADVAPKSEVAREIFAEIYEDCFDQFGYINNEALAELKKKYIGEQNDGTEKHK